MKLGIAPGLLARDFWKSLDFAVDWVEGEVPDLVQAGVSGIFVNPDDSEALLPMFKQVPRPVVECQFIDFIEVQNGKIFPQSFMRMKGSEFLTRGTRHLETHLRAYITGDGPWARLFCLLAVEKGFAQLAVVVDEVERAQAMIERLSHFCFGVKMEVIRHADLTLQPNNGSLLVNTVSPEVAPDLIADLAYLNYLSPKGLVVETHESAGQHALLEEARNSKLAVLSGEITQGFAEYQAFNHFPGLLPWSFEEYFLKRQNFFLNREKS